MASKVCHSEMHGRHWTPLGVAGADVYNRFPLDSVLLGCEQEAEKVGLSKHGIGRRRSIAGMISDE